VHICYIAAHGGGYQIRTGRAGPGQTRFFAVRKHGGHLNALQAAARCALELHNRHPPRLNVNNRSRMRGVRVEWRVSKQTGNVYPYLAGRWRESRGKWRCFAYSIERHGLEGAVRRALALPCPATLPTPSVRQALRLLREAYPELGRR
jgi:hypothetical protein